MNAQLSSTHVLSRCILWVALCLGLTGVVLGQAALSTLRGTVYDQTGAVVPGVEVTITEVNTGVQARSVVSDEQGAYEAPDLRPGTYRVTAELPGFRTFVADQVVLDSGQIRRVNVLLETGEITDQVTVEAGAAVITTESGTVSGAVTDELIKDASTGESLKPYPGPQSLLATLPGVSGRGWNLTVAGQTDVATEDDGVRNEQTGNQAVQMHAWEEMRVVTVNAPAEQARAASFNTTSKRGSNAFHGKAFYRHSNSAFGSREFFHPERLVYLFHDVYADVGGPIIRDRTFFFAAWNNAEMPGNSFPIMHVPTLSMRQGDFSQFSESVIDPLTGEPFPGNLIPAERMNPVSLNFQERWLPQPNLGGPNQLTNNHGHLFPYPPDNFRTFYPLIRVDHELTERNSLFFRYTGFIGPYVLPRPFPNLPRTRTRNHGKYAVNNTHVFSSSLINTLRVGFNTNDIQDGTTVDGVTPPTGNEIVESIGLQGVNPRGLEHMGAPVIEVSGLTTFSAIPGGIVQQGTDWSLDESLTWTQGRHVLKFGGQYLRFNNFRSVVETGTYGDFSFDGTFTNHPYADFLLGLPQSSSRRNPLTDRWRRAGELGLYVMDTFKLTPNVTLDYGLRWEYYPGDRYDDGLQFNWDPQTGNLIVPEAALSQVSPLYPPTITIQTGQVVVEPSKSNFRPRFGVAYRMTDQMVLRGGYGVYSERIAPFLFAQGGGPFDISETFFNSIENGEPFFSFPNPFPEDALAAAQIPSVSASGYPSDAQPGTIHQFNLSLERQFGDVGIRLSYVGSRSRGLHYNLQLNKPEPSLTPFSAARRPYPEFVGASFRQRDGKSNYDSMQLELNRRVGMVSFNANYTWASNLHNHLNTENPYDVTSHWSRDDFQPRHRGAITTMIDLPWGRGRRFLSQAPAVVDHILGGWRLQTTSFIASGKHFSPRFSGSDPSNTNTFGGLPDRICDGNLPRDQRTLERWFDPSCFVAPQEGSFGDSAPNILVGPGIHVHHLALVKQFRLGERFVLTYNASFSNVFNRPHFNDPRNNISVSNPGQIVSQPGWTAEAEGGGRRGQMMLRLEW